jgi:hypothetical protein
MPQEIEHAVVGLVTDILRASTASTPDDTYRGTRGQAIGRSRGGLTTPKRTFRVVTAKKADAASLAPS